MSMRNHIHKKAFYRQTGLTLVEIMVAITLSLVILAGVIEMFVATKQTYRVEEGLSRVQENARYAMTILAKDVRHAGYWGCANTTPNNLLNAGGGFDFSGPAIEGTEGASSAPDTLTLRGAYSNGIRVEEPFMNTNSAALHISSNNGLQKGDIIIVSDCSASEIFQISGPAQSNVDNGTLNHNTGNTVSPGNNSQNFSKKYKADANVLKAKQLNYSIQTGVNGLPALFRSENGGTAEELVEGVESLQVLYGRDTDSDGVANRYYTADLITSDAQWEEVVSIRIGLLMQTVEQVGSDTDTRTYNVAGTSITSSVHSQGRYFRYVINMIIKLRNRGCSTTVGC